MEQSDAGEAHQGKAGNHRREEEKKQDRHKELTYCSSTSQELTETMTKSMFNAFE